ncbi:MAG: hypothetical protein H0W99_15245, partial [Acidobacteria bacterium]|nr:hypothetical protein [Acidobacteriota bacterium]
MNKRRFTRRVAFALSVSFMLLLLTSTQEGVGATQQPNASPTVPTPSASPPPPPARDERLWREAQRIHRQAIIVDGHNDITTPMTNHDYD